MTIEVVDIGAFPNDGTGDPLRLAFAKINNNFTQSASAAAAGPQYAIQYNNANALGGSSSLLFNSSTNTILTNADFIPTVDNDISIGNSNYAIGSLYLGSTGFYLGNLYITETDNVIDFGVAGSPGTQAGMILGAVTGESTTVSGSMTFGGSVTMDVASVTTSSNSPNQLIYQTPASGFSNGTFKIVSRQAASDNAQDAVIEVVKNNSGSAVSYIVYGTTFTGIAMTTYDADIVSGNVRVYVSPLTNQTITHTATYQINT